MDRKCEKKGKTFDLIIYCLLLEATEAMSAATTVPTAPDPGAGAIGGRAGEAGEAGVKVPLILLTRAPTSSVILLTRSRMVTKN